MGTSLVSAHLFQSATSAGCALTVLSLAFAGCHGSNAASGRSSAVRTFRVETAPMVERSVPRTIPLTGTLTADVRTDLTANASGRVAKTFIERGQRVDRGTVIAQLDVRSAAASAAEAQAAVARTKSQLEAAEADCERNVALVARGAISPQEHDKQAATCRDQLAALAVSEARATSAALAVGDGTIRAPFAGIVTERFVSIGDYVQASSKVVTLVVGHPLRLKLTVPERRIVEVKEGALVTFSPTSMPTRTFSGTIKYLSGEVRPTTRDVIVEAVVPNPDGALLPGMFVDVSLRVGERTMAVVPKAALFDTGQDSSVYLVENGHLVLRTVLPGPDAGDAVALEEGASPGDIVVTNPTPSMFDGAPVE